ncbi:hypothetical protein [Parasitella parasitica]|uniref:Reverse transcriptase RNase H-like domain-containing protein n=1 Tax=Parasitella parasitica TaxID=35722 RepID=A0A0B7N2B7_9FUNG|nr:hypothetical protein [Parasitella parasitica]
MAGVTQGLQRCKVYLDDLIVFSPSLEDHEKRLRNQIQPRESTGNARLEGSNVCLGRPSKGFLDFVLFIYHRFIKNLASVAAPLYRLLMKDVRYEWTEEANNGFETLKKIIMPLPTLAYPDPSKPYNVHTDASMHGLDAVIVQDGRPVAFASRTLTPAEKIYSTTEQEALCVVYALKHFYPYLYNSASLTIYTDHAALKSILSTKEPKGRIARWILTIQGYSFTIVHRKGALNVDADALSRRDQINSQDIQAGKVIEAPSQGGSGVEAVQFLSSILKLKAEQLEDKAIQAILKEDVKKPYTFKEEILWYQYEDGSMVPITPQSMVKSLLLRSVHNLPTGGHYGVDKTLAKVRLLGWWPTMMDDISNGSEHATNANGTRSEMILLYRQ